MSRRILRNRKLEICSGCCETDREDESAETEEIRRTKKLKSEDSESENLNLAEPETADSRKRERSENQEKITVTNSMDRAGHSFSLYPGN